MPKPWENAEGYHDPTAYHGTKNIIRDEDEQQKRVNMTFFLFGLTMITPFLIVRFVTTPKKCGTATRRKRWRRWKSSKPMAFTGISIKMIC